MVRLTVLFLVLLVGCDDSVCEDGDFQCTDHARILQECVDGQWVEEEDCDEQGMVCHDLQHCVIPAQ